MEQASKKSEFKAAYGAGRQAFEKLGRRFWLPVVAVILARPLEKLLVTRYSLSALESSLLSVAVVIAATSLFLFVSVYQSRRGRGV